MSTAHTADPVPTSHRARRRRATSLGLVLTAAGALLATAPAQAAAADLTVAELPLLPGTTGSFASAINDTGTVVGHSGGLPTRWAPDGTATALATLPGQTRGGATAINNSGVAVGTATLDDGTSRPVRWAADGTLSELTTPPDVAITSVLGINDSGTAVGMIVLNDTYEIHAARWNTDGTVTDLGTLPGGTYSQARAINDSGTVVGFAEDAGGVIRAVRWTPSGTIERLATPGTETSQAWGINDSGSIVGFTGTSREQALRWDSGGAVSVLAIPADAQSGRARDINDNGQITGSYYNYRFGTLPSWWEADGTFAALENPSGYCCMARPWAINNSGVIVGNLTVTGSSGERGVRWTPVVPD
ncbi:hypothetical protein [Goodfellowiella coeruleoviolacea]|uniref:Extracellular repeat, HAF family n=1 Tax=Goodfellowiella coeruleoviolacea TaxID=334858 RepID=A0AAE3GI82_9PSEU|nr:hypothetical protein [Goodfellowiella coeruleoviolacea]MCP2168640.1 putative extracellular repeat, HAF family [Goodfellowiella coeruleoviolacea]